MPGICMRDMPAPARPFGRVKTTQASAVRLLVARVPGLTDVGQSAARARQSNKPIGAPTLGCEPNVSR